MKLDQINVSTVRYSYTSWSNFSMIEHWWLSMLTCGCLGSRLLRSATTWSSACISASFFIFDWLNCDIRALNVQLHHWSQPVNKQLNEPAETQLMYSMCVDCGSHDKMKSLSTPREWRAGTDELLTMSLNSAVDRSRDLSAFRPLTFHCTSGSYVWRIRLRILPFMCVDKLLENKESGTSSGLTYQRWFSNFVLAGAVRVYLQLNNVWYF